MAERRGFEPRRAFWALPGFQPGPFVHSGIAPLVFPCHGGGTGI